MGIHVQCRIPIQYAGLFKGTASEQAAAAAAAADAPDAAPPLTSAAAGPPPDGPAPSPADPPASAAPAATPPAIAAAASDPTAIAADPPTAAADGLAAAAATAAPPATNLQVPAGRAQGCLAAGTATTAGHPVACGAADPEEGPEVHVEPGVGGDAEDGDGDSAAGKAADAGDAGDVCDAGVGEGAAADGGPAPTFPPSPPHRRVTTESVADREYDAAFFMHQDPGAPPVLTDEQMQTMYDQLRSSGSLQ